jgi:hypothetical protein
LRRRQLAALGLQAAHGDGVRGQLVLAALAERRVPNPCEARRRRVDGVGHRLDVGSVVREPPLRTLEQLGLHLIEEPGHARHYGIQRERRLAAHVATRDGDLAGIQVAWSDLEAQRHTLQFPLDDATPESRRAAGIQTRSHTGSRQLVDEQGCRVHRALVVFDGDHHDLDRRDARRHAQPGLVAVRHDEAAHHAGARARGRRPAGLLDTVGVGVGDAECPGEVLPELVAGRHLQRLAVSHHRLAGHGVDGAGEPLARAFDADGHRDGQRVLQKVAVDVEVDAPGVGRRIVRCGVRGVALLPEELRGAQEQARPQLPANDVRPLVEKHRQVAVRLDPLGHQLAEHGLARRAHHDRFRQLLAAGVGDDGELGAEAFHMLRLALQVGLRDEQRQVDVLGAGRLDAGIHIGLHALPHRVGVRSDDHGAAHRTVVGQLCLLEHILIPPRKVVSPRRQNAGATLTGHRTTIEASWVRREASTRCRHCHRDSARAWTEAPAMLGALWERRYRRCRRTLQRRAN